MRDFLGQLLHYFDRPHVGLATLPLDLPAAWRGDQMRESLEWTEHLAEDEIGDLEVAARRILDTERALETLTAVDVPLPRLAPRLAAWRRVLTPGEGRGFVLARGLPVARWGQRLSEVAFWSIGLHLGEPGGQNPSNELLGHVRDEGDDLGKTSGRAYRTRGAIRFHCDAADVVGLLCLQTAPRGGASRIVSSVSVFNTLLAERPDLAARLFEPFTLDARNDAGAIRHTPVQPCCFDGAVLRTFYHSDYFRSAPRHDGIVLDDRGLETLDAWEEIAERETMRLDMQLAPGDVQLLSNHTVVHARTAYVDPPGSRGRRHLLRLWLSLA
jgi:hypothetical protein